MSTTLNPFGLRPAYHPSGLDRQRALAGGIVSGYANNILKGQAVKYAGTNLGTGTSGTIVPVTGTEAFAGAFCGVEWTDVTGRRRVSNFWPASTTYIASSCIAYFYDDPNIVYEIQADGSVPVTAVNNETILTTANLTAGSTTTGLSQSTLASASFASTATTLQLRVVDIAKQVDNAAGDAYTICRVTIASQLVAITNAIN